MNIIFGSPADGDDRSDAGIVEAEVENLDPDHPGGAEAENFD
ncbi:MAG: hypothetical protein ABJB33_04815 [Gemmatimonadota bacterium]